jgi:hypothetical protein
MTTKSHLALFDITLEQASDFIQSHVGEPQEIFDAAWQLGIPTSMLSDITGYSTDIISEYFSVAGLDTLVLDAGSLAGKREIFSSESAASLSEYVVFNDKTGILSTSSLRESAIAATNADDYLAYFDPANFKGAEDGIFTIEELGIEHLGDIPATSETLESLSYGTMINLLQAMDLDEFLRFNDFIESNPDAFENGFFSNEAVFLMIDILSDPAEDPFFSNPQITLFVVEAVVEEIDLIGIETGAQFFEGGLF